MRPLHYTCSVRYEPERDLLVSVVVAPDSITSRARASGLVLLVGVGSYIAYRLCLKLLGCRDLASLLHYLCKGSADDQPKAATSNDQPAAGRRCRVCKRRATGSVGSSEPEHSLRTCRCSRSKKSAKHRRCKTGFFAEEGEFEGAGPSSGSSEGVSTDEREDCETSSTELTAFASDCSGAGAAYHEGAQAEAEKPGALLSDAQRRRWRNSVGKRTNALDDPNGDSYSNEESGSSITGFSNSRSPPPIPRSAKMNGGGKATMSQSMPVPIPSAKALSVKSMQSLPSSQQFIWDPVCTPGEEAPLSDELLSFFADVPTGELVQRFLDGLPLFSDQNRADSPGPSEAASEFSLTADRQIGDGTAEDFERLQCDLSELRTDVDEFDAELTTYLQERSDCLKSDSRVFYRSVIVDDSDEPVDALGIAEACSTSSPSSSSPEKEKSGNDPRKTSPCHRTPNKRPRHHSSTGSSNGENNNKKEGNSERKTKRRRQSDAPEHNTQQDTDRRSSLDDQQHSASCECSSNEKSALSLDTGYVSSYHTLYSSATETCSPCGSTEGAASDEQPRIERIGQKKRPTNLPLPLSAFSAASVTVDALQLGSGGSSLCESFPWSSSGPTPSSREEMCKQRSPSAFSLEWDDDALGPNCAPSPSFSEGSKVQFEALDLFEYLRCYHDLDKLGCAPRIYQFAQKLVARGYQRVLLHGTGQSSPVRGPPASRNASTLDNLVMASLLGAAYYRWAIFRCHSFQIIPEAVDVSMKRCSFFADRCSNYFGSTTAEGTRAYILQCMQKLWQLHESVQHNEQSDRCASPTSSWSLVNQYGAELIDGVKVLMALRSLETYEEILFTRHTPFTFYADLFRICTPSSYAEQKLFVRTDSPCQTASSNLPLDDLDIALLADTLGVRIEVFRPNSRHPESVAVYPTLERTENQPRLPLLQSDGLFLPLI